MLLALVSPELLVGETIRHARQSHTHTQRKPLVSRLLTPYLQTSRRMMFVSNVVSCEWCCNWKYKHCAGLSKSLYKVLSGSPGSVMWLCSCCEPKVKLALKFFDEIEEHT